ATQQQHLVARATYVEVEGIIQPAPAPRFSRTPGEISQPPLESGTDNVSALKPWSMTKNQVEQLERDGTLLKTD
ncbi:MAG: CoA transferase, partial [Pseudomonadota bacterium]